MEEALEADLICTTGGTMHGPVDHLHPALERLGAKYVVNTVAVTSWLQLASTPEAAQRELAESTARAGRNWAGLGVRVNSVRASGFQSARP